MARWSLLTSHARVLICLAEEPNVRLSDVAAAVNITERRTFTIIHELTTAGFVVVHKEGRRNRYEIQVDARLDDGLSQDLTVGELLRILPGSRKPRPQ